MLKFDTLFIKSTFRYFLHYSGERPLARTRQRLELSGHLCDVASETYVLPNSKPFTFLELRRGVFVKN